MLGIRDGQSGTALRKPMRRPQKLLLICLAALALAVQVASAQLCSAWCTNPCEEITGDTVAECGGCTDPSMRCRPGMAAAGEQEPSKDGLLELLDSVDDQTSSRVPVADVQGCDVVHVPSSPEELVEMARSLNTRGVPTILRGIVSDDVMQTSKGGAADGEVFGNGLDNPAHAMCTERSSVERSDMVPAGTLGPSFVEACAWAETSVYGASPLWQEIWNHAPPTGHVVISRNRAVGFHQHGPTFNALLSGTRQWFMFDLRDTRGNIGRDGWDHSLPRLRLIALNETREPSAEDWLPFALANSAALNASVAYECLQEAGDVMFVPNSLFHAIITRGYDVSRATFFIEGKTVWDHDEI